MSESDDGRPGVGWLMEPDSDGWRWWTPHWDQRLATDSVLALAVEALRRGIDLRDAAADNGEDDGLAARALLLVAVLILLYRRAAAERAETLGLTAVVPSGTGAEIAEE